MLKVFLDCWKAAYDGPDRSGKDFFVGVTGVIAFPGKGDSASQNFSTDSSGQLMTTVLASLPTSRTGKGFRDRGKLLSCVYSFFRSRRSKTLSSGSQLIPCFTEEACQSFSFIALGPFSTSLASKESLLQNICSTVLPVNASFVFGWWEVGRDEFGWLEYYEIKSRK